MVFKVLRSLVHKILILKGSQGVALPRSGWLRSEGAIKQVFALLITVKLKRKEP
ncbi:hypothetical protein X929_08820 [Petrotoga olearia DSM 13574]|uniref:Uncharacterized protein n=1 Tax=Petrotoga olearia DSM 13574 TaxID=1122955 RepID=A0A2K1NX80_9BACT|nr:hypothetical protein X929_08820 [Petrotoga olearia DSM 13574]